MLADFTFCWVSETQQIEQSGILPSTMMMKWFAEPEHFKTIFLPSSWDRGANGSTGWFLLHGYLLSFSDDGSNPSDPIARWKFKKGCDA